MSLNARAALSRWETGQRKPVPAHIPELVGGLRRLRCEAVLLAMEAYEAIQHSSYEPYWLFREKLDEHGALIEVIRGRLPHLKEAEPVAASLDDEEIEILVLAVQSCLKFCYALSARPLLPVGARETFFHELDALRQARRVFEALAKEKLPAGILDELDQALMLLEEIVEKAPSLVDFAPAQAAAALFPSLAGGSAPAALPYSQPPS